MSVPITTATAALLGPLYLALGLWVIHLRRTLRVSLGDGGQARLLRATRAHANFGEWVPFVLVALALGEAGGAPGPLVLATAAMLVLGRLLHAWGLGRHGGVSFGRFVGTTLTLTALASATAAAGWAAVFHVER